METGRTIKEPPAIEQLPTPLCGTTRQLSGTILTQYSLSFADPLCLSLSYSPSHTHTHAQSSHIRIVAHLLLNQLPIFHICHGVHILPPPSLCLFFFFSPGDLSSPYLESVQYFAYFCFSLDTVFSSVPGFPFEVNQINLRPDRDTVCVCVGLGEAVREMGRVCALRWPSLALASYFQLVITASVVLPLPHLARSFGWRLFAALHNMCVPVCAS